jgi:hypothetical protein
LVKDTINHTHCAEDVVAVHIIFKKNVVPHVVIQMHQLENIIGVRKLKEGRQQVLAVKVI